MKILLIDNYDSFTYNIIELLRQLGYEDVLVVKNDDFENLMVKVDAVIVSPGPGLPFESGHLMTAMEYYISRQVPIFGICLGLQAIVEYFGGQLTQLPLVYHGIQQWIDIQSPSIFYSNIEDKLQVGRYHSWVANDIPKDIIVTAMTSDFEIMSLEHAELPVFAVQYHPESYMTPMGKSIVESFLTFANEYNMEVSR